MPSKQVERIERLEVEIRRLRGSLEPLAQADEVSSPQKMAAIAKAALKGSRRRISLSKATESRSLLRDTEDAGDHDRRWEPGF